MTAKYAIQRVTNALFISGNMLFVALVIQLPLQASAWGSSSSGNSVVYGMSMQRDWYDAEQSNTIAIKYEGCVWGNTDGGEDMGCMDDESEDGTASWYMMANCRRAQVAYSVYASSGSTSCSNNDFKESLITRNGVAEFVYTMGNSYNSAYSESPVYNGMSGGDFYMCEAAGDGIGYLSVGCDTSGNFVIDRFVDMYCAQKCQDEYCNNNYDYDSTTSYDSTYDTLSTFNSAMNNLNSCFTAYNYQYDSYVTSSLIAYLLAESSTCSSTESSYCTTTDFVSSAGSSSGFQHSNTFKSNGEMVLANRLKYAFGGSLLLGSVIMFFGILFTNRRKRRALMHRKFRNGPSSKSKSKKSGGSTRSKKKKKKEGSNGRSSGVLA